jgi:uncharacterized protein (TIGR02996 family)
MTLDRMLTDLIAVCLARPDSRTPFAILSDYLEEQGDPRCNLLRDYLSLWTRAEALPVEIPKLRNKLDLSLLGVHERQLRNFACLCVRLTPLLEGRRAWDVLHEEQVRQTIGLAELYNAELVPLGQMQSARIPSLMARTNWGTLAAWNAAWAKSPNSPVEHTTLAAECIRQVAMTFAETANPALDREHVRRNVTAWQQQLAMLCAQPSIP